jgi:hypothetical protein
MPPDIAGQPSVSPDYTSLLAPLRQAQDCARYLVSLLDRTRESALRSLQARDTEAIKDAVKCFRENGATLRQWVAISTPFWDLLPPPEQASQGRTATARSTAHALGCLFADVLTQIDETLGDGRHGLLPEVRHTALCWVVLNTLDRFNRGEVEADLDVEFERARRAMTAATGGGLTDLTPASDSGVGVPGVYKLKGASDSAGFLIWDSPEGPREEPLSPDQFDLLALVAKASGNLLFTKAVEELNTDEPAFNSRLLRLNKKLGRYKAPFHLRVVGKRVRVMLGPYVPRGKVPPQGRQKKRQKRK